MLEISLFGATLEIPSRSHPLTNTASIVIPRSIYDIQTPQLIGIIAGTLVFLTTIFVVFYLFYKSGSVERLKHELISGTNEYVSGGEKSSAGYYTYMKLFECNRNSSACFIDINFVSRTYQVSLLHTRSYMTVY
jgi:hypothetical protein